MARISKRQAAAELDRARNNGWSILVRHAGIWYAADCHHDEREARYLGRAMRNGGTRTVEVRKCSLADAERIADSRNAR